MEKIFDYEIKNFIEEEKEEGKKEKGLYLIDILEEINNNFNIDIIKYSNEKGYNYILLYLLDYNKNLYIEIDDFYRIRSYLSYNYGLEEQQATFFETFDNIEELKKYINRNATTNEQDNTITLYDKELNFFIINYKNNLIVG